MRDMTHQPFTQEQLEWISEATHRAVVKSTVRYRRSAVAGFVVLLVGVALALYSSSHQNAKAQDSIVSSGNVVAVDGCNRDYTDRVKFRSLLLRLQAASDASYEHGQTTAAQHSASIKFYHDQLDNYQLLDCRQAAHILTNNPQAEKRNIDAFWVGNPRAPQVPRDLSK